MMLKKYGGRRNFHIVNNDFITHDFGDARFDVIYFAATIQWLPEECAFSKTYDLLKPGGMLAMMYIISEYKSTNEALYEKIQRVYSEYFKPECEYVHGRFKYDNAVNYGYIEIVRREYPGRREFTADEYVAYCGTHCGHIVIPEPYRTKFFDGLYKTVRENGNRVVFNDRYVLYLARTPI